MKRLLYFLTACLLFSCAGNENDTVKDCSKDIATWGDQGNGTYINPILAADYSDPEIIRVDSTFYLTASDFHFMGNQVLKSKDLVNWELISQVYSRLPGYDSMTMYGNGSWAPAMRYHDGKFYTYFCTPTEGLYMSYAEKPEGPWSEPLLVHEGTGRGWEDPCPFWDDNGDAYLGHSRVGAGYIDLHRMSPDGTKLLDEGTTIYEGPISEGTKFYKRNGYYYLCIPEGGVDYGWQTILRSKNMYGPWEKRLALETGTTNVNGPHQGAMVDTPDGSWWFVHFQTDFNLGRIVHLQPVFWIDDWPVFGTDIDRNGVGEPVYCWKMPVSGTTPCKPASSDTFDNEKLALQWQFNHNPINERWSLTERPGWFSLHALKADGITNARNSLTQKVMGYKGTITVKLDYSSTVEGQYCGLGILGMDNCEFGVRHIDGKKELYYKFKTVTQTLELSGKTVYLRFVYDYTADTCSFLYSFDNMQYLQLTDNYEDFKAKYGSWKGARPALFSYTTAEEGGTAYFDNFEMIYN